MQQQQPAGYFNNDYNYQSTQQQRSAMKPGPSPPPAQQPSASTPQSQQQQQQQQQRSLSSQLNGMSLNGNAGQAFQQSQPSFQSSQPPPSPFQPTDKQNAQYGSAPLNFAKSVAASLNYATLQPDAHPRVFDASEFPALSQQHQNSHSSLSSGDVDVNKALTAGQSQALNNTNLTSDGIDDFPSLASHTSSGSGNYASQLSASDSELRRPQPQQQVVGSGRGAVGSQQNNSSPFVSRGGMNAAQQSMQTQQYSQYGAPSSSQHSSQSSQPYQSQQQGSSALASGNTSQIIGTSGSGQQNNGQHQNFTPAGSNQHGIFNLPTPSQQQQQQASYTTPFANAAAGAQPQQAFQQSSYAQQPSSSLQTSAHTQQPHGSQPQPQSSQHQQHPSTGSVGRALGRAGLSKNVSGEKYGMLGLLNVIRMTDLDLNTLALGSDLTTLGLNLNSTDMLYSTFTWPSSDNPVRTDPDYVLPSCYYQQPPPLKTSHLAKFTLETLFYIFYNMPADTLQLYAAKELYNREWKYHKELQLWMTRSSKDEKWLQLAQQNENNDLYIYFDITGWERRPFRDVQVLRDQSKFMNESEFTSNQQ